MRLLVVEDEAGLADGIRRGLEAEGYAVDVADNGIDGLWRATEHDYGAIVLDLMLPGKNGLQVCAELRAAGRWTPVLVLTARDGEQDEARSLDTGADDFLAKPFSPVVLSARLRALLRRGAGERPTTLQADDLRLDPGARRVWRGADELALTARETSLLEYLLRRKGETVSKLDVLDNVWDDRFEGDPNIVEVYVRRLRNKVDRPYGRDTITTVRGSGYRLEVGDG
ncbi:MAG: response regulator transcription factor [Nocardioidaceae bacterium]|nr:response regulator transcription factor [Nocardioidaceae bacterium]